jgi:hypothetical protein
MSSHIPSLEVYLTDVYNIHASGTGVKETSYYPPLTNLFNAVGRTLKPRVTGILNPKSTGAGIPDIGFYTATQLKQGKPTSGQATNPERGAVEAKGASQNLDKLAKSVQVAKYLKLYRLVLVTNLREFLLIEADEDDQPILLERYALADDEAAFWLAASPSHRSDTVALHRERLTEFLRRVLLYKAPLTSPEELARFLASYAREALARLEQTADLPALTQLKAAMQRALGIQFEGSKGEHFFRSTLVQTLFYGVFSAWVIWHRTASKGATFDWRAAAWTLHVPMIRTLFEEISKPTTLQPLGIDEVLDWTTAVLNRVQRTAFFKRFQEEQAVQYFYEPFLEAFDPDLRKELGVWYTPPEIVEYMVERVDRALRTELGLSDGLADPNVYVLDPACGTGAYLVEVVRRINRTLEEQGADALTKQDLKKAVRERLFGFELLPAPFVVAHLQLGLLLQELGTPLNPKSAERAAVYLTNSLTGWEDGPALPPITGAFYPELQAESDAAREVKRQKPILVVIGNPPYNAYAGTSPEEENGLVEPYKQGLISEWGIKKFNLDELYVRFFRLAERRVAEKTGRGVVCFITNFSYLRDPSFVVMRRRLLGNFDQLWFDNLNGDSRETGKTAPNGLPDPSVFSTAQNPAGIRKGAAIGLMVRVPRAPEATPVPATVHYRELWGAHKRGQLLDSLVVPDIETLYETAVPTRKNKFSFKKADLDALYESWPTVAECASFLSNGLMEKRGGALMSMDKEDVHKRFELYFNKNIDWRSYENQTSILTTAQSGFLPQKVRVNAIAETEFSSSNILTYSLRPFDDRWAYYTEAGSVWNRSRPSLKTQLWDGNAFFVSRPNATASEEGTPFFFTRNLGDNDSLRGHAYYFPVLLKERSEKAETLSLFKTEAQITANLSATARAYLISLGITDLDKLPQAGLVWYHALAVGYSPLYRLRHAAGLQTNWPRLPLPAAAALLQASASLGQQVAALLSADVPLAGVSTSPAKALQPFGKLEMVAPATEADLSLTASWGHGGHGKPVMPGSGRAEIRPYSEPERQALEVLFAEHSLTPEQGYALVGQQAFDVYLNDTTRWAGVPEHVWSTTIGGYQVLKKWLSYRELPILGRSLSNEEARYVSQVVRRLLQLLLLAPALDANYTVCASNTYSWPTED